MDNKESTIQVTPSERGNEIRKQYEEGLITHAEYINWVIYHAKELNKDDLLTALVDVRTFEAEVVDELQLVKAHLSQGASGYTKYPGLVQQIIQELS